MLQKLYINKCLGNVDDELEIINKYSVIDKDKILEVKKIVEKDEKNKAYQSFFKLEYKTEQKEKQLFANIRDRKAKKMVEESIKASRDNLIKELSAKEDMLLFVEQTYNTYLPPKNTSLSMHFQYNTN